MRFTFVKVPEHRKFKHDPIYYDADKEEREERERRIRLEMGLKTEEDHRSFDTRIRGQMRRRIKTPFEVTRSARKKSNLRLIVIFLALMALFYYLLQAGYEWYSRFL